MWSTARRRLLVFQTSIFFIFSLVINPEHRTPCPHRPLWISAIFNNSHPLLLVATRSLTDLWRMDASVRTVWSWTLANWSIARQTDRLTVFYSIPYSKDLIGARRAQDEKVIQYRLESGSVNISGARYVVWEPGTTRINMPQFCAAVNCTNKSCKGSKLSFFRFPWDTDRFVHRLCMLLNVVL